MKNGIIANLPVGPKFNGGAMTVWGIISAIKKKNEKIFLILICEKNIKKNIFNECKNILENNNIDYEIIYFEEKKKNFFHKIKNFINSYLYSSPDYFFLEQKKLNNKIKKIFLRENFDKIYCYHFDALSACYEQKDQNIICCMGDLMHEPRNKRRLMNEINFLNLLINKFEERLSLKITLKILSNFKNVGFYANHYYEKIKIKRSNVNYFKTSIILPNSRINYPKTNLQINKILLVGDLSGTVTISSLLFLKNFLKNNSDEFLKNYIFKIIGGGNISKKIETLSNFNNVSFVGALDDMSQEFDNQSILLACNTIDVGIRVRVITALSYGLIVITHSSNLKGIPELQNYKNAFIFENNDELKKLLLNLNTNKLRISEISDNAFETFKENFYFENAFNDLQKKIK